MSELVRWVLASANPHKVRELAAVFDGFPVTLAARPPGLELPEETGTSFLVNARLKARAVADATGEIALADDSGLEVDALGGEPGVLSARYAGPDATDEENRCRLLAELRGIHGPNRRARFRCVLALVAPDGREVTAEGRIEGFVTDHAQGSEGFGYDPLFRPEGDVRTLAQFPAEEKNLVSHRARAAERLRAALTRLGRWTP